MINKGLIRILSVCVLPLLFSCDHAEDSPSADTPSIQVDEHIVQGYLGEQHLANLVYRKGREKDTFVGWGRTPITEWPIGSASSRQVVPEHPDHRYSNGGTAMDVDGDGVDEIITARGTMNNLSDASLIWFKEVEGRQHWEEQALDSGLEAPHSLVVADLNEDDRADIIVGEMTAGGWNFPYNPSPKIYAYINRGDLQFERRVLYEDWGVHEMRLFPEPYDGKIMVYAADEIQPQKFDGMQTHVSYWLIDYE